MVVGQYNSRGFLRGGTGDDYPSQAVAARGFAVLSFHRPLEFQASMERKGRRYARRRAMLEWTDRASVHDALVDGLKSVAKSQSIDFDHIAITVLSDGDSPEPYELIHSRFYSLPLLRSSYAQPHFF